MRILLLGMICAPFYLMGCASSKTSTPPAGAAPHPASLFANLPAQKLSVTPANGLSGKVIKVNVAGRFLILNFPIGHLPAVDQQLNVYRLGLKVGEVRVSGPQMDDDI